MNVLQLFSVPAAVLPAVVFVWFLWWKDRTEREPKRCILGLFAYGATIAYPLSWLLAWLGGSVLENHLDWEVAVALESILVAPLVEEPAKAALLLWAVQQDWFDDSTDGFVYGAAAGMGFAMTENLVYFNDQAAHGTGLEWATVVVGRTLFSALMHGCATAIVGAAIGYAKYRATRFGGHMAAALGLVGAYGIHTIFNGLLNASALGTPDLAFVDVVLVAVLFSVMGVLFFKSIEVENRDLVHELRKLNDEGFLNRGELQEPGGTGQQFRLSAEGTRREAVMKVALAMMQQSQLKAAMSGVQDRIKKIEDEVEETKRELNISQRGEPETQSRAGSDEGDDSSF